MTKKSTLILAVLSLLAVGSARADKKLVVTDSSSETPLASFPLGSIDKLSFAEGSVVFNLAGESEQSFALSNTTVLKFVDGETAISQVAGNAGDIKLSVADGSIAASGIKTPAAAALYTVGGQKVINLKAWTGTPVSTARLADGVYILKVNNKSFKFVKK